MRKNTESLGLFCPSDLLPTGRGREQFSTLLKISAESDSMTANFYCNVKLSAMLSIAELMCIIDDCCHTYCTRIEITSAL